ncbi:hypothetical protein Rs2_32868 [Raphanus sativus]|nr:hypothetical protein Rs2_32868 [Raphanus sativus]
MHIVKSKTQNSRVLLIVSDVKSIIKKLELSHCALLVETFPEPNRRLLLRILKMMHTITCHSRENRMTSSAVAACMSPLLLRPLLAGECDLEGGFDALEDNSAQLLAAANAANNAQAIVTSLLEDYGNMINVKIICHPVI